jgi:predicted negative regulator of RcsB-dependent stress response
MANHLDLEEQEQLDQLKHFWKQYGNLITWALILVLGAYAGWNLFQRWQIGQAAQASAMFDEVDRASKSGDLTKLDRVYSDIKDKFGATSYAQQAALMAAKAYFDANKPEEAKAALSWVVEKSSDSGYQSIARLRLAAILVEGKAYDNAFSVLKEPFPADFVALAADRRGDILLMQGKKLDARSEYEKAFKAFDDRTEYRRLVEVKLNSMGVSPQVDGAASSVDGKK